MLIEIGVHLQHQANAQHQRRHELTDQERREVTVGVDICLYGIRLEGVQPPVAENAAHVHAFDGVGAETQSQELACTSADG